MLRVQLHVGECYLGFGLVGLDQATAHARSVSIFIINTRRIYFDRNKLYRRTPELVMQ